MFTPFLVFLVCCVVLNGAQTVTEDYPDYQPIKIEYPSECGLNEVLSHCVGCPPEDSCYDRNQIACPAAFLPCHPGCVCKEGFIRKTLNRECIPKEECGAPCPIFEEYTECKQCSNETCSSITNPVKCDAQAACTPGCTCWDGYHREDENSPCVHRCFCPALENSPDCVYWKTPLE